MHAPVKTKVMALLRLSKEATGENSLGATAYLVQDLRPITLPYNLQTLSDGALLYHVHDKKNVSEKFKLILLV